VLFDGCVDRAAKDQIGRCGHGNLVDVAELPGFWTKQVGADTGIGEIVYHRVYPFALAIAICMPASASFISGASSSSKVFTANSQAPNKSGAADRRNAIEVSISPDCSSAKTIQMSLPSLSLIWYSPGCKYGSHGRGNSFRSGFNFFAILSSRLQLCQHAGAILRSGRNAPLVGNNDLLRRKARVQDVGHGHFNH